MTKKCICSPHWRCKECADKATKFRAIMSEWHAKNPEPMMIDFSRHAKWREKLESKTFKARKKAGIDA